MPTLGGRGSPAALLHTAVIRLLHTPPPGFFGPLHGMEPAQLGELRNAESTEHISTPNTSPRGGAAKHEGNLRRNLPSSPEEVPRWLLEQTWDDSSHVWVNPRQMLARYLGPEFDRFSPNWFDFGRISIGSDFAPNPGAELVLGRASADSAHFPLRRKTADIIWAYCWHAMSPLPNSGKLSARSRFRLLPGCAGSTTLQQTQLLVRVPVGVWCLGRVICPNLSSEVGANLLAGLDLHFRSSG